MSDIPPPHSSPQASIRPAPIWKLLLHELVHDDILLRASALAYSTLASLVPIFAIILAILSGPAFRDHQEKILDKLAGTMVPNEADDWILNDAEPSPQQEHFKSIFRENIVSLAERAGAVSIFGFLLLFITVGMLFRTVERAFNVIWRAASQRSIFMRLAVATSVIFWGPVMAAVSITLTEKFQALPFVGSYLLPMLFSTMAFTTLYMVMPNTKVRFHCALLSGIVTALCWEGIKLAFLVYVTQFVSYNRVYGSLGLIPMLFLWVYVNWVMVLAGAELAYCLQFRQALSAQWQASQQQAINTESTRPLHTQPTPTLLLAVAIEVARHFQTPCPGGIKTSQIAEALQIENSWVQSAAERLVASGILLKIARDENSDHSSDDAYVPAGDPKALALCGVLDASLTDNHIRGHGAAWEQAQNLIQSSLKDGTKKISLADIVGESAKLN